VTLTDAATLSVHDVWKAYGGLAVLKGVSCTFTEGRIAAIVGPNGAGKTTFMRIAAGLQRADKGVVDSRQALYYGGFDTLPRHGRVNDLRRALSLLPVAGGQRKLAVLSRGELQRVGLDAALDLNPRILFLDEPWSALEPDAREELNARLSSTSQQRITICSSHDLDEVARQADEVFFLANGVITREARGEQGAFDRERLLASYRERKRS
jgi:ABC-2 type transport system ATP-binding protein